jgi:hypothetical protein
MARALVFGVPTKIDLSPDLRASSLHPFVLHGRLHPSASFRSGRFRRLGSRFSRTFPRLPAHDVTCGRTSEVNAALPHCLKRLERLAPCRRPVVHSSSLTKPSKQAVETLIRKHARSARQPWQEV